MHTTRLLTVSPRMHCVGGWGVSALGVSALGGVPALGRGGAWSGRGCLVWGRCLLLGGGCLLWGKGVCSGGVCSGGVPGLLGGAWSGVCLLQGRGGACSGGCLVQGVSAPGGAWSFCLVWWGDGIPVCTEADPTPCTEFLTHATENITFPKLRLRAVKNFCLKQKRVYFK